MKSEAFAELVGSMKEALEHAQGKRSLRTTALPRPPASFTSRAVRQVRAQLHASQTVFASYLNVSTKLVQAWEAGRRQPEGPALVLLHIAARQPEIIEAIRQKPVRQVARQRSRSRASNHADAV
jgi:putative transcriptional regulator